MGNFFLKIFTKIFSNKKALVLSLSLILILSLLPLHFAQANIFTKIATYVVSLPFRIGVLMLAAVLGLLGAVNGLCYMIIVTILKAVSVATLQVPIMPDQNGIVEAGFNFTRGFANMFFLLILVFIGLATILRIKEYQVQKLLPTLILVILLTNFIPVIVGVIADTTNIFTRFFLDEISSLNSWNNLWDSLFGYMTGAAKTLFSFSELPKLIGDAIGLILLGVIAIAFNLYAGIVYLFVLAIFIGRVIAFWILIILGPIAFALYIFPITKGIWKEWWSNLIKWAIVGIPVGFFLWLSTYVKNAAVNSDIFQKFSVPSGSESLNPLKMGPELSASITGALTSMLGPLTAIIILHMGVKMSRKYMPAGAEAIISGVQKIGKIAMGTAAVALTGGAAAGLLAKGLGGMSRFSQGAAEGTANQVGRIPGIGGTLKTMMKPGVGATKWANRGIEGAVVPKLLEYQAKTQKAPDEEIKKVDKINGAEAKEAYIKASTQSLPNIGGIKRGRELQFAARLAETGDYKNMSSEYHENAESNARQTFDKENADGSYGDDRYMKEADAIADADSEVFAGKEGAKSKENKATHGKKGAEIEEARQQARKEIKQTRKAIEDRLKPEDLELEIGLKLKYVTKGEIAENRNAAINKVRSLMTDNNKHIDDEINGLAASAAHVKELKPEDIKNIASPRTLANRIGMTLGNPANLQKIQQNFGNKTLVDMFEGRGGFNDAAHDAATLDRYAKENPRMVRALHTNPALREMDWEGRDKTKDKDGNNLDWNEYQKERMPEFRIQARAQGKEIEARAIKEIDVETEEKGIEEKTERDLGDRTIIKGPVKKVAREVVGVGKSVYKSVYKAVAIDKLAPKIKEDHDTLRGRKISDIFKRRKKEKITAHSDFAKALDEWDAKWNQDHKGVTYTPEEYNKAIDDFTKEWEREHLI